MITSIFNYICTQCIEVMKYMSANTGLSYGTINVLLFIIINPLVTMNFAVAYILKQRYTRTAKFLFYIGVVITVVTLAFILLEAHFCFLDQYYKWCEEENIDPTWEFLQPQWDHNRHIELNK